MIGDINFSILLHYNTFRHEYKQNNYIRYLRFFIVCAV